MPGLTPVGECEYNGHVFDATSVATMQVEFVPDDADRTVAYHRHTLTVKAVVAADPACDHDLETIRMKLGEPRRNLKFTNRGFGTDLSVGGANGTTRDVKFGPHPRVLSWESLGGNRAAAISWQVVFCIAVCDSPGKAENGRVLSLNYDTTVAIDKHLATTRTISGHVQIALNTKGGAILETAEDYLNRILVATMPGFDRTVTRHTSIDRTRCDFTIVDSEIVSRNALPPDIIAASGQHRVRWARGNNQSMQTRNSLSVQFSPRANLAPATCWAMFAELIKQRTAKALANKRPVMLDEIEAEEDIWGRTCSFSASWRVLMCLRDLLTDSGIWTPLGTNWASWATSLKRDYWGTANIHAVPDVIVDICQSTDAQMLLSNPILESHGGGPGGALVNTKPPPEQSYLSYQMYIETLRKTPTVQQSVVQPKETGQTGTLDYMGSETSHVYPKRTGTDEIIQVGGKPRYSFRLIGQARRAGYPIPRPQVSKIGESPPTEVYSKFAQRPVDNLLGVPVYHAVWEIGYHAPYSPSEVKPASNLENCIDETGTAKKPTV